VLQNGRTYRSLIQVRKGSVVASIDGKVISKCSLAPSKFSAWEGWSVGDDGLGIGSFGSPTVFKSIKVIEISGPGKPSPRGGDRVAEKKSDQPKEDLGLHAEAAEDHKAISGPTTRVSAPSATIKALEVYTLDSGILLGRTSEAVLTVTRGNTPKETSVQFVTPVGGEMRLARDEAMRYIRITYPNWNADSAEISFEDKYTAHDGGSIGTAIATMVLSAINGFQIDPNIAVTGDISANGKVRAIGGVSAKLRGAIASKCTLLAIPTENQGQLVDAVTYSGPELLSDIQIIGISNIDDVVATVRTNRDAKLAQAISMFSEVQLNIKNVPGYLKRPEAKQQLAQLLELAPRHLSAKLLLHVVTGKQPKTLSATATFYYTSPAVRNVLAVLSQRDKWQDPQLVPSGVVRSGLADLRKLIPLADPNAKPLVIAWMQFIEAWNDFQQGQGSGRKLESRAQALMDEMTRENTNAELMQKTLKEGFSSEESLRCCSKITCTISHYVSCGSIV